MSRDLENVSRMPVGIDQKIRTCQEKEMQHLIAYMSQGLAEFAQQSRGDRNFGPKTLLNGLVCGKMVLPGANATDTGDYSRHLFGRAALKKFFKPAHRSYIKARPGYTSSAVKHYADTSVAFDPGHRLDRYLFYGGGQWRRLCPAHHNIPFA
jgi:hypothetical protein